MALPVGIEYPDKMKYGYPMTPEHEYYEQSPAAPDTPELRSPSKDEFPKPERKMCSNCYTHSTPLWRFEKVSGTTLCNACGVYFKSHGVHRPVPSSAQASALSYQPAQMMRFKQVKTLEESPALFPGPLDSESIPTARRSNRARKTRDVLHSLRRWGSMQDLAHEEELADAVTDHDISNSSDEENIDMKRTALLEKLAAAYTDTSSPLDVAGAGAVLVELRESVLCNTAGRAAARKPSKTRRAGSKRPAVARTDVNCAHCGTSNTPLWRKDRSSGDMMCNACGIYLKTHGKHRPLTGYFKTNGAIRPAPTGGAKKPQAPGRGLGAVY